MSLGADVYNYAFWQSFLAAIILLGIGLVRQETRLVDVTVHWKFYIVMGFTGIAAPNLMMFQALTQIPASLGVVIIGLIPIIVLVLSLIIGTERADTRKFTGLAIAFAGVVLIVLPQNGFSADAPFGAILLTFAAVFGYAAAAVMSQRYRPDGVGAIANASGMMLGGAILLLPCALFMGRLEIPFPPHQPYDIFILGHGFVAATAFSLFFLIVALKGAVFYSQSTYVIAVSGILWGMVLFSERPGGLFWLATGFIFAGLMLVNSKRKKPDETAQPT